MDELYCEAMQTKIARQIEEYKRIRNYLYNKDTKARIGKLIELLEKLYDDFEF
jgi:hypothetical protein